MTDTPKTTHVVSLTEREHATILAALRLWQATQVTPPDIIDIATDCGRIEALYYGECDELVDKLNSVSCQTIEHMHAQRKARGWEA